MKETDTKLVIEANIYCEKQSHKGIIIGKGGEMLKKSAQTHGANLNTCTTKKYI